LAGSEGKPKRKKKKPTKRGVVGPACLNSQPFLRKGHEVKDGGKEGFARAGFPGNHIPNKTLWGRDQGRLLEPGGAEGEKNSEESGGTPKGVAREQNDSRGGPEKATGQDRGAVLRKIWAP